MDNMKNFLLVAFRVGMLEDDNLWIAVKCEKQ